MHQAELLKLIKAFDSSGLSKLRWAQDGVNVELEKASAAADAAPAINKPTAAMGKTVTQPKTEQEIQPTIVGMPVKAPLVGIMYNAPAPGSAPFVKEGQQVKKGEVLCIIEAMKMMNELLSPIDGIVTRIYVNNETMVAFDQILFEVTPC